MVLILRGGKAMMKKVCMIFIFVSVLLFGCSNEKKDLKEDPGLDKSQKIEVSLIELKGQVVGEGTISNDLEIKIIKKR